MQIVWEESGYLPLSHQDTHTPSETRWSDWCEMTQTLTVMVLRGAYLEPCSVRNSLVELDLEIWAGALFIDP